MKTSETQDADICEHYTHIQIYKMDSTDFRRDTTEENILRNVKNKRIILFRYIYHYWHVPLAGGGLSFLASTIFSGTGFVGNSGTLKILVNLLIKERHKSTGITDIKTVYPIHSLTEDRFDWNYFWIAIHGITYTKSSNCMSVHESASILTTILCIYFEFKVIHFKFKTSEKMVVIW